MSFDFVLGFIRLEGSASRLLVHFVISRVLALGVTILVIGLQIWQFTKPALSLEERKATLGYIPALALLFAIGISAISDVIRFYAYWPLLILFTLPYILL